MGIAEIALWSASLGIFAVCLVAGLVNSALTRTVAGLQSSFFIGIAGLFVAVGSGLFSTFIPVSQAALQVLNLATGALTGCVGALGLRLFLRSHSNDPFVQRTLVAVAAVCAACGLLVFWPQYYQALEIVAVTVSACAFISFWLALRSALRGDRMAWPMAVACVAMVMATMGLYAMMLKAIDNNLPLQAVAAVAAAAYLAGCVVAVWRRNSEFVRMRRALSMHREKDLLTQLWTGAALIRRVEQTIGRARRNRQETAIVCVEIFNANQLRLEMGTNAIEQVIYSIAARVRQSAGSSKEVGRYADNSFVIIVENVKRPSLLRAIGLRLSAAVRAPYMLNPYSSSPREFRADVGIGVARLPASRDPRGSRFSLSVRSTRSSRSSSPSPADTSYNFDNLGIAQEAMHDASELAKKARAFTSRVAIVDAYSRKVVAVEQAELS